MRFFYDVYWDLEPTVDLTKPEKCEEAEVGGGVHGGDLVRDALLLSVVHLAIIIIVVSITLAIIIIIFTRPKPAYGRQGLAGSWGQDTDEVSTMETTLKNHGNQPPLVQKT